VVLLVRRQVLEQVVPRLGIALTYRACRDRASQNLRQSHRGNIRDEIAVIAGPDNPGTVRRPILLPPFVGWHALGACPCEILLGASRTGDVTVMTAAARRASEAQSAPVHVSPGGLISGSTAIGDSTGSKGATSSAVAGRRWVQGTAGGGSAERRTTVLTNSAGEERRGGLRSATIRVIVKPCNPTTVTRAIARCTRRVFGRPTPDLRSRESQLPPLSQGPGPRRIVPLDPDELLCSHRTRLWQVVAAQGSGLQG